MHLRKCLFTWQLARKDNSEEDNDPFGLIDLTPSTLFTTNNTIDSLKKPRTT